jgi:hypothetical protein
MHKARHRAQVTDPAAVLGRELFRTIVIKGAYDVAAANAKSCRRVGLRNGHDYYQDRYFDLERLLATTPATSPEGALYQLIVASSLMDFKAEDDEAGASTVRVARLLHSALPQLAKGIGFDTTQPGYRFYRSDEKPTAFPTLQAREAANG